MEFKNYPKRKPSTVMDRQSMDKIQSGILQKKLEAKVNDDGQTINEHGVHSPRPICHTPSRSETIVEGQGEVGEEHQSSEKEN